jgi:hypothetical protein
MFSHIGKRKNNITDYLTMRTFKFCYRIIQISNFTTAKTNINKRDKNWIDDLK